MVQFHNTQLKYFMSFKITVTGRASTEYSRIEELMHVDCQDNFAHYFDDDFTFKDDIASGYMSFNIVDHQLMTIVEYYSSRELTEKELDTLLDYSEGQLSDGVGEGYEQNACYYDEDDNEVFISPWDINSDFSIMQEFIEDREDILKISI